MARFIRGVGVGVIVVSVVAANGLAARAATSHPVPVQAAPGHAVALCPNPAGLRAFTRVSARRAGEEAAVYGRRDLAADLANADRAWWPHVRQLWRLGTARRKSMDVVLGTEAAARSGFAVFLRPACGAVTLARTLMVTVGPSQAGSGPHCSACNAHFFYVDRDGHPLLWFIY